jgi:hypothetical protein
MYNATIYYPIPHIIIAVAVALVIRAIVHLGQRTTRSSAPLSTDSSRHPGRQVSLVAATVTSVIVMACMLPDATMTYAMYRMVHETGGCGRMSGAIHDLTAYVEQQGDPDPVAMDWGLNFPIEVTSFGALRPVEMFTGFWDGRYWFDAPPPSVEPELRKIVDDPRRVYLAYAPEFTVMHGRIELLRRLAAERGKRLEAVREVREGDGRVLYVVYRII